MSDSSATRAPNSGIRRLVLWSVAIVVSWQIILPKVARLSPVKRHLEFLEEKRIDPSAMFYTDLEMVDRLLQVDRADESMRR